MRKERERQHSDSFYDTARQCFSNTLWMPLIMIGAALAVSAGAAVYLEISGRVELLDDVVVNTLLSTMPMYLIGLPLGWLVLRKMPTVRRQKHRLGFWQFLKFFPISMAAIFAGSMIGLLLQEGIAAVTGIYPIYEVGELVGQLSYPLVIGVTVIAAPIAEELVFRKFLIDRVQQYGTRLAILFSGISFGLFHGNITQCFYASLLGMVFAYVYTLSGRVLYPILLHMMVNFFNGFLSLLAEDPRFDRATDHAANPGLTPEILYSAVSVTLMLVGAALFFRDLRKLRFAGAGMELEKEECFSAAFLNSGFIVLFVYFLFSTVLTYLTV